MATDSINCSGRGGCPVSLGWISTTWTLCELRSRAKWVVGKGEEWRLGWLGRVKNAVREEGDMICVVVGGDVWRSSWTNRTEEEAFKPLASSRALRRRWSRWGWRWGSRAASWADPPVCCRRSDRLQEGRQAETAGSQISQINIYILSLHWWQRREDFVDTSHPEHRHCPEQFTVSHHYNHLSSFANTILI